MDFLLASILLRYRRAFNIAVDSNVMTSTGSAAP
jgi:hypothetical protein